MSEQLSALETTVARRFGKFVAGHAEEALLWLPMDTIGWAATGSDAESSAPVAIRRVVFETAQKPWMSDADASDVPFFGMDVILDVPEAVRKAHQLCGDARVYVELTPGAGWDVNDQADQLLLIDSKYDPEDPYCKIEVLGKVLDLLERQEAAGKLMAAHKRRFPLDQVY